MSKYIAVQGCSFSIDEKDATLLCSVTSIPSTKVKIDNKGVYSGSISVTVTGWTDEVMELGTGIGVINSSANKISVENKKVLLEGDFCTIAITGVSLKTQSTITVDYELKISSAGQNIVKGE